MHRFILPLMLLLLFGCNQRTPTLTTETRISKIDTSHLVPIAPPLLKASKDPILSIRKAVQHINTSKLKRKQFDFMCDEVMKVDYYFLNKEIVKIAIDFGTIGDVYAKEEYYYTSGKLIFVYELVEGGPACEGCIKTDEYRTYIQDNNVIKHLKNKNVAKCRKCDFNHATRHYKLLSLTTTKQIRALMCSLR
ncbi:MAG: hypothetical protein WKF66_13120 [Pedobacter sp.]